MTERPQRTVASSLHRTPPPMTSMTDGTSDHTITSPSAAHNGTTSTATPPSTLPALLPTPPQTVPQLPPPATDPAILPTPAAITTAPTSTTSTTTAAPCQTLYIHHLNEKTAIPDLRKSLYLLFSQFGHVLHVSAARTDTTRGQAWVVMGGMESAVRAVNEMDGLMVYGRPMKVEFAKEESDVARRARGETVPKREKRKRLGSGQRKANKLAQLSAAQPPPPAAAMPLPPMPLPPTAFPPMAYPPPVQLLPPNRVLFVEQLPPHMTHSQLQALWTGQAGLVECRLVGVRPGVAFVEFGGEMEATEAMRRMQGLKVEEGHAMRISYAKK